MMTMFRPFGSADVARFRGLDRDFERLFEGNAAPLQAPADVIEADGTLTLRVDLPGVPESDVKVSVENNVLTVQATRRAPEDVKGVTRHLSERTYGAVTRAFKLPTWADTTAAVAKFEHGVLSITMPRKAETKPRNIEIKVG